MALWHLFILCPRLSEPTDPCIQNRNICSRQSKGQCETTHKETKNTLHAQTIVHSILLTMIRFQKKNSFWKTVNYGRVLLSVGYDTICQVVTYPSWRWTVHKWMPTAVMAPALGCWQQNAEEDFADTPERGQEKPGARATSSVQQTPQQVQWAEVPALVLRNNTVTQPRGHRAKWNQPVTKRQTPRDRKQTLVVKARGGADGEWFQGYRVSVLQDEKSSKRLAANNVNILNATELYT